MLATLRKLPKNVIALGWVSFLADIASEMVFPILPAFIASTLKAGTVGVGLVEGIADSTAAFVKLFSGRISDRMPKRLPLVVSGYTISGISKPLVGIASIMPVAAIARFTDRVGKGLRTAPRDALISESVPPENRGAAFGVHRAMDHFGAVIGPLICALLLFYGFESRTFFYFAAIPGLLAVVLILVAVKEPPRHDAIQQTRMDASSGFSALPSNFKRYLVPVSLFALGNSSDAFLLLRLGAAGISPVSIALLWSLHHVVKSVFTGYGGHLTDRFGRRPLIISGWVVYALVYICFGFVESQGLMIAVFLVYGIYFGLSEPAEKAIVADMVGPEFRGTAYGWFHGSVGLMAFPASLLFGIIWSQLGAKAAFGFGAVLSCVACVLLITTVKSDGHRHA